MVYTKSKIFLLFIFVFTVFESVKGQAVITNLPHTLTISHTDTGQLYNVLTTPLSPITFNHVWSPEESRLEAEQAFDFDNNTGILSRRAGPINFGGLEQKTYLLSVGANDGSGTTSKILVLTIIVNKGIPNLPPQFKQASYQITVNENKTGTQLFNIKNEVTDDQDSVFFFTIDGPEKDRFDIDSGYLIFKQDYFLTGSTRPTLSLTINATDSGGLTATTSFSVTINNIKNPPDFTNLPGLVKVPEIVPANYPLIVVSSIDRDNDSPITMDMILPPEIPNSEVDFDPASGVVSLTTGQVLDYEGGGPRFFLVQITATDGSLTSTGTLTVSITNINEMPIFKPTFPNSTTVPEGKKGGLVIFDLTTHVSDPEGSPIKFRLNPTLHSDKFAIDESTGRITFAQDYNADPSGLPYTVTLEVAAADPTTLSNTATLTLTLTDVNQVPEFSNLPSAQNVSENSANDSVVMTLVATDGDSTDTLSYSLVNPSPEFVLQGTQIRVGAGNLLDFEKKAFYTIRVAVTDGKATDTQTLTVLIQNIDEAPYFIQTPLTASILEGTTGGLVYSQIASNARDPENKPMTYTFLSPNPAFNIDGPTGIITYAADYNASPGAPGTETLIITASDPAGNFGTLELRLNISNINQKPSFTNLPSSVNVTENSVAGFLVLVVAASDPDLDGLTYSMVNSVPEFELQAGTSNIVVAPGANLDYETTRTYFLNINVTDGKGFDVKTLTVQLTNEDEPPVFSQAQANATVQEGLNGTIVYPNIQSLVQDPEGGAITFSLPSSPDFTIDPTTGTIRYQGDYNIPPRPPGQVVLNVQATDPTSLSSTLTLTLTIEDVNQLPKFTNLPFTVSVSEDKAAGFLVYTFSASDGDSDPLTFEIASVIGDFSLQVPGSDKLVIAPSVTLDYETKNSYAVVMNVTDGKASDVRTLTIQVTNVEEPPIFNQTTATVSVQEGKAGVTVYSGLSALVSDPEKQALTYNLPTGQQHLDKFQINPFTGIISFKVDYNADPAGHPSQVTLQVVAMDTANLTASILVTIDITEVNNIPTFTQLPITVNVSENTAQSSVVFTFAATDLDSADVASLVYAISNNVPEFEIQGNTLVVSAGANLDFETKTSYPIIVNVTDGKGFTTETLTIQLADVNEPPSFSQNLYTVSVQEGPNGTVIYSNMSANVVDPEKEALTFTLIPGPHSDKFAIDANTGVIKFSIDYNADPAPSAPPYQVTLNVQAADSGSQTAVTSLVIDIADVNNPPTFTNLPGSATVAENSAPGFSLFQVQAVDGDSGDSLTFSLTSAGSEFEVQANGDVVVGAGVVLDFESQTSYAVQVNVTDGKAFDIQTLTVNITNVEEPPTFSPKTFTVTVPEGKANTPVYSELKTKASDPEGTALTFSFQAPVNPNFNINTTTGIITYAIDYNADPSGLPSLVTLVVIVADAGNLQDTATVTVNITEVNNPPKFTNLPDSVTINEDLAASTSVFTFAATDLDSGDVAGLSYVIVSSVPEFVVSGNELQTAAGTVLDYETKKSYTIQVNVSDGKDFDSQTLTVNIADVDEPPVFAQTTISRNVAEGLAGKVIVSDLATLVSDPEKQTLTYSITPGANSNNFVINSTTGAISYNADYFLGSSGLPGTVNLVVVATDPTLNSGSTTIDLTVVDSNQSPVLTNLPANVSQPENVAVLTEVFVVAATDSDGTTPVLKLESVPNNFFAFDPATGRVTVKADLDFETNQQHELVFTATDGTLTATSTLTVAVTDINEAPVITNLANPYNVTVSEGPKDSVVVSNLAANIADPEKQTLTYSILGAESNRFNIDPSTGVITFAADYYFGTAPVPPSSVSLVVTVTDSVASATLPVDIKIEDVNHPPMFSNLPGVLNLAENVPVGHLVHTFATQDKDGEAVTLRLAYSLPPNAPFQLNSTSGELRVASPLDYEAYNNKAFIVGFSVSDAAVTSSASVTISILDINEGPVFGQGSYTVTVPEGPAFSVVIPSLNTFVSDPELKPLTFTLQADANSPRFRIDGSTLKYGVEYDVDRFGYPSSVPLSIRAIDSGFLTATATFNIVITEINHPPAFSNLPNSVSISENTADSTVVFTARANDVDASDTLSFSLERSSGEIQKLFQINSASGVISTKFTQGAKLDYETQGILNIQVLVRDGKTNSFDVKSLKVFLTNFGEPPVFSPLMSREVTVDEGKAGTEIISSLTSFVSDPENDQITFRLAGTQNSDKFTINPSSGSISFLSDYDADPTRLPSFVDLTIVASDPSSLSATSTIRVRLRNVNQDPTISNLPLTVNVPDSIGSGSVVFSASTSDPDSADVHSYLLSPRSGDTRGIYFGMNSQTGQVLVLNSLREAPTTITYNVQVSDGTAKHTEILTINIQRTTSTTVATTSTLAPNNPDSNFQPAPQTSNSTNSSTIILIVLAAAGLLVLVTALVVLVYRKKCRGRPSSRGRISPDDYPEDRRHHPRKYQVSPRYPVSPRHIDGLYFDPYH